ITNTRWGGTLTAGLFLEEFVGDTPWVHLDIAGPSRANSHDGEMTAGGTGFGVRTLVELARTFAPPAKKAPAKKAPAKKAPAKKVAKKRPPVRR
ncbi:MAG: leucyl aminopeptidase, partial [Acidimicrobiia bacterium]|nr:leucyl aminopeptidase [Acidimicrobiia bacterium]